MDRASALAEQVRRCLSELQAEIDRNSFLEFLNVVIESVPPTLSSLRATVSDNPNEALFSAHKLSGSVSAVGAADISVELLAIEQALQRGETEAAVKLVLGVEAQVGKLLLVLESYR